ncbi:platelet endothelial cell adhesion molecule-like [Nelusetta ayraudi]|uniref:platelet endothelial cell adhesion molecule-like n=1 Tax=Nelusetta ayraudi TaxID=303726 RepID=UPI003F6FE9F6
MAAAQKKTYIKKVTLSIKPSHEVAWDTNVTLRCQAVLSKPEVVQFTIYKSEDVVCTQNMSSSNDLLCPLTNLKVANSGPYSCGVKSGDKEETSSNHELTVTEAPVLQINPIEATEGDEITLTCVAPEQAAEFYFYRDSENIKTMKTNSTQAGTEHLSEGFPKVNHSLLVLDKGPADFTCELVVKRVEKRTSKNISVAELFSAPTLTLSPAEVFQEDEVTLTCRSDSYASERLNDSQLMYSLDPPQDFLYSKSNGVFYGKAPKSEINVSCVAKDKNVTKSSEISTLRPKVPVSIPEISVVGPAILGQPVKILCRSHTGSLPINYTLVKGYTPVRATTVRLASEEAVFTVESTSDLGSYKCEAKNSLKNPQLSEGLIAAVIVPVSIPEISVVGPAILGQPVKIFCRSHTGSLPINYTLVKGYTPVRATTVRLASEEAVFTVESTSDLGSYKCEAKNSLKNPQLSERLIDAVTVPLSNPTMTVIPDLAEITEGGRLYLICSVEGTPPVTFKWYRSDDENPVYAVTSYSHNTHYQIPVLSRKHSGRYRCEAANPANNIVYSDFVDIHVPMALWKKALIAGVCALVVSALVVVLELYFKSKRGKETYNPPASQASRSADISVRTQRPPETVDNEESSVVTTEPEVDYTEVVNAQPVDPSRAPCSQGTDTVYSELQNSPPGIKV